MMNIQVTFSPTSSRHVRRSPHKEISKKRALPSNSGGNSKRRRSFRSRSARAVRRQQVWRPRAPLNVTQTLMRLAASRKPARIADAEGALVLDEFGSFFTGSALTPPIATPPAPPSPAVAALPPALPAVAFDIDQYGSFLPR